MSIGRVAIRRPIQIRGPRLESGMAIMGVLTGSINGELEGVGQAVEDDSVDLPTLEEYEDR